MLKNSLKFIMLLPFLFASCTNSVAASTIVTFSVMLCGKENCSHKYHGLSRSRSIKFFGVQRETDLPCSANVHLSPGHTTKLSIDPSGPTNGHQPGCKFESNHYGFDYGFGSLQYYFLRQPLVDYSQCTFEFYNNSKTFTHLAIQVDCPRNS